MGIYNSPQVDLRLIPPVQRFLRIHAQEVCMGKFYQVDKEFYQSFACRVKARFFRYAPKAFLQNSVKLNQNNRIN